MTFARILARQSYWREYPPLAVMARAIAQGLGIWKPAPQLDPDETEAKLRELFPSGNF